MSGTGYKDVANVTMATVCSPASALLLHKDHEKRIESDLISKLKTSVSIIETLST